MTSNSRPHRSSHDASSTRSADRSGRERAKVYAELAATLADGVEPDDATQRWLDGHLAELVDPVTGLGRDEPLLANLVNRYVSRGHDDSGGPRYSRRSTSLGTADLAADLLTALANALGLEEVHASESSDDRLDALFAEPLATRIETRHPDLADPESLLETARLYEELRAEVGLLATPRVELTALPGDLLGESRPGLVRLGEHFDPFTREGRALFAHELVHESQRTLAGNGDLVGAEFEATSIMSSVLRGGSARSPLVPLPPGVYAACGPQAMAERAQAEEEKDDEPDPNPNPVSPGTEKTIEVPYAVEVPVPFPVADIIVPTVEIPLGYTPIPVPFRVQVYAPNPRGGGGSTKEDPIPVPVPVPGKNTTETHAPCETKCPEPLPEHLTDAPVKRPAEAPKGEGEVRTLKLAGHTIQFRLPKDAKAGQIRVRFRNADSPFGALTLKTAVLTLGDDLKIKSGQLHAEVRLGKFVHAPNVTLTVTANGNVALTIKDARLAVGSVAKGKVDLFIGPDGIWGNGLITAQDVALGAGFTMTDGRLAVRVSKGGAVTAHGKLGIEFKKLGKVEVEVCFADGKLSGKVTAELTREINLGVAKITRIKLGGCFRDQSWKLTGEVDFTVRDWVKGTVVASVEGGKNKDPEWVIQGDLHQTKVASIGPLDVHDAHLTVKYDKGKWAPAKCDVLYQMPKVRGKLEGTIDLDTWLVDGQGEAEIWEPIKVGPVSLDEGQLVAKLEKNKLTEIIGSATLRIAYRGQPTFELTCEQAIYEVKSGDVHAQGAMSVMRDLVLGSPHGLHAKVPQGHAGNYSFEFGRLVHVEAGIPVHVNHGESPIGLGSVALDYAATTGFSGHLDFGLIGRTGLPSFASGPLFLLPGASFRVDLTNDAFGVAKVAGLQWEILQNGGPGHLCGTLDGRYDFDQSTGALTGEAWVFSPWTLAVGGLANVTLKQGGELTVAVGDAGLEALSGTLPFSVDATEGPLAGLALAGQVTGSIDPTTGQLSGTFDVGFGEGTRVALPERAGYRVVAIAGTTFKGTIAQSALASPIVSTLVFDVEKHAVPFLNGRLDDGVIDLARGEVSGTPSLALIEAVQLDTDGGRFAVWLDPKSRIEATLEKSAITGLGGTLILGLDEGGERSAELTLEGELAKALSGSASLKVFKNIRIAERKVGDTLFAVELSTETGGKVVLVDNKPTTTEGKLVLEVVGNDAPFARGSFEVSADLSKKDSPTTMTGELKVFASLPLGTAGDFSLSLEPPTAANAKVVDGGLESLDGKLTLGLTLGADKVGSLEISGEYQGGKAPVVNGDANISIIKGFALFDAGPYSLGFAPSTFKATLAKGQITEASGHFGLHLEQRGSDDEAPLGTLTLALEGHYTRPLGAKQGEVDGKGAITVEGEFRVAQAGDFSLHLTNGSVCTAEISKNKISKVDGQVKGRVDLANPGSGEGKRFLGLDAKAHYRPEEGGKIDAEGTATMLGRRKIFEADGASFWLAPGLGETSATIVITNNDVKQLDGKIGAEVHDAEGPLFGATVQGIWNAATGQLDGMGSVMLMRNIGFPAGRTSGPRVEVLAGSFGKATVTANKLDNISGLVKVRVHDERGPLVEATGIGSLDAKKGRIEQLTASARLLRSIDIGGVGKAAALQIRELSGIAKFVDGDLNEVSGALSIAMPRLGEGFVGTLSGGWKRKQNDGEDDRYWGKGELAMPIIDDKATGRKLGGKVGIQVAEDGSWVVNGKLDYQLAPRIGGKVSVEMTQELDPIIGVEFKATDVKLADARPLFDKELTLLPPITMGTPLVQFSFGVTAGLGLEMSNLMASADIKAKNWKPLSEKTSVPDFDAALSMSWGLDASAELSAYLKVSLGLGPIASINGGVRAGLALDVPIRLNPKGKLWGNKDGFGGELDIGLTIKPKLALDLTPFVGGEIIGFDIGPHEFDPFTFDLGAPFDLEWGTKYTFGDKPKAPVKMAPDSAAIESGRVTKKSETRETPKSFPTKPAATKSAGPGLPAMGDEAKTDLMGGGEGGEGTSKLAAMMKALDALSGVATAAAAYMALGERTSELYTSPRAYIAKMKAAWEEVAAQGRLLFAACEGIFGPLKYSVPMWVRLIIEAPPGQTPDFLEAWAEEDDYSRRLVAAGIHGALPLEGQVQLIEAMMRGSCGDEDEASILKILEHAHRHGYAKDLVKRVGAGSLRHNLDGDEHDRLLAFFARAGIDD